MDNTRDLSKFGYKELNEAGNLLKAYCNPDQNKTRFLGDGVALELNLNSGTVFLVDEDYNVAMLNGEYLEDFFSCPQCGHEGFLEEMEHGENDSECQEYLKQIKE